MKKYLYLLLLIVAGYSSPAQRCCLTNTLIINTGYDAATNAAIAPGINGGKPVRDPHWVLSAVTPSIATAITGTALAGLIEVVPGSSADIITPVGGWTASWPNSGWISCLNSNYYTTDGAATTYEMTLGRPFRICGDDSVIIDMYIAADNYVVSTDFDGTLSGFSEVPFPITTTYFTTYAHVTQTVFATAGTHTINITVGNINVASDNPSGINVHGTITSKTTINDLVAEADPACAAYVCTDTPAYKNAISLTKLLKPCAGTTQNLPAKLTGTDTVRSYTWTPATNLSSSTILSPDLTVTTADSGWYYLSVRSLADYNLVTNGDFECGNKGFSSSYIYAAPPSTVLIEGDYSIDTNPFDVHTGFGSFGDHTTGTGNMMILNGAPTPVDVWCETIQVTPNTDYDFSAWFANASAGSAGTYPILQFRINGTLIGVPTTVTDPVGTWVNFYSPWNSGTNTTANICIYDATTSAGGNDFVIDDITFKPVYILKDSVYVSIVPPDTTYTTKYDTVCSAAGPLTLTAPAGYLSYQWNDGSTGITLSAAATGDYWVYNSAACRKTVIDTFHVHFFTSPVVALGNDTAFCVGGVLTLSSTQPTGYTYLWSTGSTDTSIKVSVPGKYLLTVNDTVCASTDSINVKVSPIPVVDLGPDYLNCQGVADLLSSAGTYDVPTYLWNDASAKDTLRATATGKYWLQVTDNGCAAADTINVIILYDTLNFYNHDTAICKGAVVPTFVTGNADQTYQWLPTAGIATSTVINPVIFADTSATYVLTTKLTLCPDRVDSFHVDVQPRPKVDIGDDRRVCEYDTLHIVSEVTPAWYQHYIYSWTPSAGLDNNNTSAVTFTAGNTTLLTLSVSTPAGCASKDSAILTIRPGNFVLLDTTYNICPHDSVQFRPSGAIAYNWYPGQYLDDSTGKAPWVKAITSQLYTLVATSMYGCKDTLNVKVNVHPAGSLYMTDAVTIYPGESYHISPQTNCSGFYWFPSTGLDNAYVSDPVAAPTVSTKYIVHAMNEWGCAITDSINITVDPETTITLPNAFAPGSGNNNFTIIKRGIAELKYFRIFNRWGNKVFETTDMDKGWDGNYNGTAQPFGVYIYEIGAVTSMGKEFQKRGNVTLLR